MYRENAGMFAGNPFPGREWAMVVELAERAQAKRHGVVALISSCEKAGLVACNTSRSDMRLLEVQMAKQGERCLERHARLHRAEHLSLRGEFALPVFSGDGACQAPRFDARERGMQRRHLMP
jgi:DNA-binding MarR family transcriptional regulator